MLKFRLQNKCRRGWRWFKLQWQYFCEARKTRRNFYLVMDERAGFLSDDPHFERSRDLVTDAFNLPVAFRSRLRPDATLDWIYQGVAGAFGDHLENVILHLSVEQELKRPIAEDEAAQVKTVRDLAALLVESDANDLDGTGP